MAITHRNNNKEVKVEVIMLDILKTCIPIIIGALIAIIPTMVEKYMEQKNVKDEQRYTYKQNMYVELISLFAKVLKAPKDSREMDKLRNCINLISITGSTEVVKALDEYIDTWGKEEKAEQQNSKYCNLIKAIRTDLGIDKTINESFPNIGLRDINIKV